MIARVRRISNWFWAYCGLALIAYVPFLVSAPGRISVDTKLPLFLNPSELIANAAYLWDPQYASGTVTHQNIGYLFPMGPFFWIFERLGVSDWIAQRFWFGSLVFLAGAGVVFLFRTLYRRDLGAIVAALVYMLSPYLLAYMSRQSVILLPWVGLPWLLALTERSLRQSTWRNPALFALVTFLIGGTNATALIFVAISPILWILYRLTGPNRVAVGAAARTVFRIGVLVIATSTWWLAGLTVQKDFGIPVPDFTETVRAVSAASSPLESLRGLGNWFFYGRDGLNSWITQSVQYQESIGLLIVTFLTPIIAVAAASLTQWRHRIYFVGLVLVGTIVSVGAYPYDDPSLFGRLFKSFAEGSSFGLALRSTPRAVPLVILGLAVLIGAGISALTQVRPRVGIVAAVLVGLLAVINLAPLGQGGLVSENLSRPSTVPKAWTDAAKYLDQQGSQTRVLEIPGQDFGFSRWGATVDPLLQGLTDRPWTGSELLPFGSLAAADLLIALDRRIQEGVLQSEAVAPIARLFAAGDVVVRTDAQYERFRTARPRYLQNLFNPTPNGLEPVIAFGKPKINKADERQPVKDPEELASPADEVALSPVKIFGVTKPEAIVRTATTINPVVIAGDGEGVVDAASAGIIDGHTLIFQSASFANNKARLRQIVKQNADLVVTDTNRRRSRHWGAIRDMTGYTERAGEPSLVNDPADTRLSPFAVTSDSARTVTIGNGVRWVRADRYGDPIRLTPEDRPAAAIDGDLATGWREGAGVDATGARLVIDLDEPITADHIDLVQLQNGQRTRSIKSIELRLDDGEPRSVKLGIDSQSPSGQSVDFAQQTFSRLELVVTGTTKNGGGSSAVGFAEVVIPGVAISESVRLPTDLLGTVGVASLDHRLTLLMNRLRGSQREYLRSDEEPTLARTFVLPTARSFALSGTARLNATATDDLIDSLLNPNSSGLITRSSSYLEGDLKSRARSAFDSDLTTAWAPSFVGGNAGSWVEINFSTPTTIDHLDLRLLTDQYHSVPTRITITPEGSAPFSLDIPSTITTDKRGSITSVPVTFPAVTTEKLRFTIDAVRSVVAPEYFSHEPQELPVGIVEFGIANLAGNSVMPASESFSTACRSDLLTIDGQPFPIQITGTATAAQLRQGLAITACSENTVNLTSGTHEIRSVNGRLSGIDIDTLALASDVSGAARAEALLGQSGGDKSGPGFKPNSVSGDQRSYDLKVDSDGEPFWLVLSQSANAGWKAESNNAVVGERTLANGMANAWLVTPNKSGTISLRVSWTPQNRIWIGLAITAFGLIACLILVFMRRKSADELANFTQEIPRWQPRVGLEKSRLNNFSLKGVALVIGAIGLLLAPIWVGIVAGLITYGALRDRRLVYGARIGAVVVLTVAAAFVVIQQWRYGYIAAYDWPQHFMRLNELPWLSLLLLMGSVVADQAHQD